MMRVELIELLDRHPVVHPTRVERVIISQDRIQMVVSGHAWWTDSQAGISSPTITMVFEGPSEGALPVRFHDFFDEDLEAFVIQSLAGVGWAQPARTEIYCHAPLPNPASIYAKLQAFLASVGAFKDPSHFLNQGHLLETFTSITSTRSYLLARAPDILRRLLVVELDRQEVPYNLIEHEAPLEDRLWVRFNGLGFLCSRAWAEFGV